MLDKIWLLAFDDVGKLKELSEWQSGIEPLTSMTGVGAAAYLLIDQKKNTNLSRGKTLK